MLATNSNYKTLWRLNKIYLPYLIHKLVILQIPCDKKDKKF